MPQKFINNKMREVTDTQAEVIDFLREDAASIHEDMGGKKKLYEDMKGDMTPEEMMSKIEMLEDELKRVKARTDSEDEVEESGEWQAIAEQAVARLAVMEAALQHDDSEDEDEDDLTEEELEELINEEVQERVDSLLTAYEEAQGYLPEDYSLRGKSGAHEVRSDALRHSAPRLDSDDSPLNWESEDAVNAAFEAMKLYQKPQTRTDSASDLERVLNGEERQDGDGIMAVKNQPMYSYKHPKNKKGSQRRKRKPDYAPSLSGTAI